MQVRMRVLAATVAATAIAAGCGAGGGGGATSAEDYPSEPLEVTVAFGPGGGSDIMARTIVDILESEDLYPEDIEVVNREGGSGAQGWSYFQSQAGNPYHISPTSGSFLTTPLQADTGWTYESFTPVGLVAQDDLIFVVTAESGIKSWEQWVTHAKQANEGIAVGGIGTVNVDYINHALLAEQAGYEIDYTPFDDEGQLITALLSGSLEAIISNPAEVLGQIRGGDLVPILFTGEEPLPDFPDVPTAPSLGYDGMLALPRGVILPPDVDPEVQRWWIETMQQVVETPAWDDYLRENQINADARWGEDFTAYLESTSQQLETELRDLGALDE